MIRDALAPRHNMATADNNILVLARSRARSKRTTNSFSPLKVIYGRRKFSQVLKLADSQILAPDPLSLREREKNEGKENRQHTFTQTELVNRILIAFKSPGGWAHFMVAPPAATAAADSTYSYVSKLIDYLQLDNRQRQQQVPHHLFTVCRMKSLRRLLQFANEYSYSVLTTKL